MNLQSRAAEKLSCTAAASREVTAVTAKPVFVCAGSSTNALEIKQENTALDLFSLRALLF